MIDVAGAVQIGGAVFVGFDGPGLGAVLDAVPGCERVVLCGARPGTARELRAWCERLGRWVLVEQPHYGTSSVRLRAACDGREVSVSWSAGWFGDASPAAAAEATQRVRHVVAKAGGRMVSTPATTGLGLLRAYWTKRGVSYQPAPDDVGAWIRATSGQGRFELLPRGRERGGARLVSIDARFAYAAIARSLSFGVGVPVDIGTHEPEPYAAAWCEVEFQPSERWPFGLLGVKTDERWHYPTSGRWVTCAHWCEIELAREHGYAVNVRRAVVWPNRSRVLAGWASMLIRERERAGLGGAASPEAIEAMRSAYRSIAVQTVGLLHGRENLREHVAECADDIPASAIGFAPAGAGRWRYTVRTGGDPLRNHPEWTSHLWAVARCRLVRQMMVTPDLVAVALDSVFTTRPATAPDDGKVGGWRQTGHAGRWQPFDNMTDVYAHMGSG